MGSRPRLTSRTRPVVVLVTVLIAAVLLAVVVVVLVVPFGALLSALVIDLQVAGSKPVGTVRAMSSSEKLHLKIHNFFQ